MIFRGNVYSRELEMDTWLTVVMPNHFKDQRPHKVVYMLHGLSGSSADWSDKTMLPLYAEKYDLVFIMPEVGRSFYTDTPYGPRYFSYVSGELPKLCRNIFHISDKREDTAVMGLSMGGYGALKCALSKPEQYWLCCAFSAGGLYVETICADDRLYDEVTGYLGADFGAREENDITALALKANAQAVKPIIHTTCGTEDFLYADNIRFRDFMKGLDFEYTYDEWEGEHNWYFWDESLKRMLKKYYG
jgi:putative tributyrin esterase